jgi:hypothetical protein
VSISSGAKRSLRGIARVLALCLLLAGFASGTDSARAAAISQAAGITLTAHGGFDNWYRDGQWTPLRVTVANDGPDVSASLQVSVRRSTGVLVITRPVALPSQSRREIYFYVPLEGGLSAVRVELVSGSTSLASSEINLTEAGAGDLLLGVVAASPSAYDSLHEIKPVSGNTDVASLSPGDLPPLAASLKSLDGLVIADTDTGALSIEQRQALTDWVHQGGRLIVVGGAAWQKTAAGLGALLPVAPTGSRTITDLGPLASFAQGSPLAGQTVAAEGTLAPDAISLSAADGVTLVACRQDGYGLVAYLAIDPALQPFRGWDGLGGLFRAILARATNRPEWSSGIFNWSPAEQAAKAVPGLTVPSTWEICGFLTLYIVVVGPVNYLVLRRFKRRHLAWFTIPAIVLVFTAATYVAGYQLRGDQAVLHRLAVVEVWPGDDRAHVEQLVGLFSPRRTSYAMTFQPGVLARPLPYTQPSVSPTRDVIEQADQTALPDIRTEIGATNVFVAEGAAPAPRFSASLVQHISGAVGAATLDGSLTNQSDLTLSDAVLLAPGGAERLGTILPGQTVKVAPLGLGNGRATAAGANTIGVPQPSVPLAAPYAAPASQSTTFSDILGFSPPANAESYRRNMLLSALLNQAGGAGRGNGIYLAGWASTAPLDASLSAPFTARDLALYLIALSTTSDWGQGAISVPPGWMTWSVLGSEGNFAPYYQMLYPSVQMTFQFEPFQPLSFTSVRGLTLHLPGNPSGSAIGVPKVELYDYTESVWAPLPSVHWGDNAVTAPTRFVDPQGGISVRLTNNGASPANIQQADFTLDVNR